MTLEQMKDLLKNAISDGQERPKAMQQTNILNAEYAAGKCHAILDVIESLFGLDAYVMIYEEYREQIEAFTRRANTIYSR